MTKKAIEWVCGNDYADLRAYAIKKGWEDFSICPNEPGTLTYWTLVRWVPVLLGDRPEPATTGGLT